MKKWVAVLCAGLALAACGGGSGDQASVQEPLATSYFIDAPVKGLYYQTDSGVSGITDADGTFQFKQGESVTFKIGGQAGLEIGSAAPTDGAPLMVTELPAGRQVAQILQSFSTSAAPQTGLDLSEITFQANEQTALKEHIEGKGDMDDFVAVLEILVDEIKARVPEAIRGNMAVKTQAEVDDHLLRSSKTYADKQKMPDLRGKVMFIFDPSAMVGNTGLIGSWPDGDLDVVTSVFMRAEGRFLSLTDSQAVFRLDTLHNDLTEASFEFANCTFTSDYIRPTNPILDKSNDSTDQLMELGLNGHLVSNTSSTGCVPKGTPPEVPSEPIVEQLVLINKTFTADTLAGKTMFIYNPDWDCEAAKIDFLHDDTVEVDGADCGDIEYLDGARYSDFGKEDEQDEPTTTGLIKLQSEGDGYLDLLVMGSSSERAVFASWYALIDDVKNGLEQGDAGLFEYKIVDTNTLLR